jgi:hypothetical protein
MTTTFSTLDLGEEEDGLSWISGCKDRLGMQQKTSIIKPMPTMNELVEFFRRMPEWIYFSGHLSLQELYNEGETVKVSFSDDRVTVLAGGQSRELTKASGDFQLHQESTLFVLG